MPFSCQLLLHSHISVDGQPVFCRTQPSPVGIVIVVGLCGLALVALLVLSKNRLVMILSGCGVEICAWQICKAAAGPDALLTRIMTWVTAGVLIILTLAIVNSIKWRHYGEEESDADRRNPPDAPRT